MHRYYGRLTGGIGHDISVGGQRNALKTMEPTVKGGKGAKHFSTIYIYPQGRGVWQKSAEHFHK